MEGSPARDAYGPVEAKPHEPVGFLGKSGHWRHVCANDGEPWPCAVERADVRVPVVPPVVGVAA